MLAVRHAELDQFLAHAESFLYAREVERSYVLGLAIDPRTRESDVQLHSIDVDGTPVLAAVRLPSAPLSITDGPPAAACALAELIAREDPELAAVHGANAVVDAFASRYATLCGASVVPWREMRLHATSTVADPPAANGALRAAATRDIPELGDWLRAFERVHGESLSRDGDATIANLQAGGRLFVWEDEGEPRSMAAWTRRTRTTVAVYLVYTPKRWRGRGYASACVAALTRRCLAEGVRECVLFTDLANPTSNAIYARIGYRPRLDVRNVRFAREPREPRGRGR